MIVRALGWAGICVAVAVGALGAVAAPGVAMGGLFCATAIGVAVHLRIRDIAAGDNAARTTAGRRGGVLVGCVLAIGWVVLIGSVLLIGPVTGALLLTLLLIIGAAYWHRWRTAAAVAVRPGLWHSVHDLLLHAARPPEPRAPAPVPTVAPVALPVLGPNPASLTTAQLCLAWQRTYFALLDLPADATRTEVVRLREQLLDEIERRDPAGFTRWIGTGARPGSNPGPFVRGDE